jgi:hypothetical protein
MTMTPESRFQISALEVYAMVIARDVLIAQLLTATSGPELASIWERSTGEIDQQIRGGLVSDIVTEVVEPDAA